MSNPVYPSAQTFATMMVELRIRCKVHPTVGDALALEYILRGANEYIYGELTSGLPTESTITLSPASNKYPFESDQGVKIARGSVHEVWAAQGGTYRSPLSQGITHAMRSLVQSGEPTHYDTTMDGEECGDDTAYTLEVWPTPSNATILYVKHNRVLMRFEKPTDKPSAPYRLVMDYAIALGKAHYQQPDAPAVMEAFNNKMRKVKFEQLENLRFIPAKEQERTPHIVQTANGFSQVYY